MSNSTVSLISTTAYHGENNHFQPISSTAMDGKTTKFFYEGPQNSLSKMSEVSQDGIDADTFFAYNEFGQITKTLNPDKSLIINKYYDSTGSGALKGFLSQTIIGTRNVNSPAGGFSMEDTEGSMTTDSEDETKNEKIINSYKYNIFGNITEIINGKGGVETFEFDIWQRLGAYKSPGVNDANSQRLLETYSYYNNHIPSSIVTFNPVANGENSYSNVVTSTSFAVDALGRTLSETTSVQGDIGETRYTYESGKNLLKSIKFPNNGHRNFKYDGMGRATVVVEYDDDNDPDNTFGQPTYASFVDYNDNSEVIRTAYIPTPFMELVSIHTGVKEPESEITRDWLGREAKTKVFPYNTTTEMAWNESGQSKFVTNKNSQGGITDS
mgnify:FL=1